MRIEKFPISVVLPTYNRLSRLKIALPSFLSTKICNVQFIIIDNNSDDETWQYLIDVASSDDRIEIYRNSQNVGGIKTIFRGYCEVRAPYAIFLADDDLLIGDYIAKCLEIFERHRDVSLIHHFFEGWQKSANRHEASYITYAKGEKAIEKIFMYAGSYPGLALRMSDFSLKDFPLEGDVIYPQVKIAIEMASKNSIAIINDCGLIDAGFGDSIVEVKEMQGRPDDMGIGERLSYALTLKNPLLIQILAMQMSGWAMTLFDLFEKKDKRQAKHFVKSLALSLNVVTPFFILNLIKSRKYKYALSSFFRLVMAPSFIKNYSWFLLLAVIKSAKKMLRK